MYTNFQQEFPGPGSDHILVQPDSTDNITNNPG